jgi:hypothetical protein
VTLVSEVAHPNPELNDDEQQMLGLKPPSEARYDLIKSSRGINHLLRVIEYIKVLSGGGDGGLAPKWLLPAGVWKHTFEPEARVDILEKEITTLNALKVHVEQKEADNRAAQRDLAAIPGKDVLDRTQRYQNSNRRHMYKLEARLDQLQARRKEEEAKLASKGSDEPKQRRKSNFAKKSKNHGPAHHRAGTAGAKSERHDARPIESETRGTASFRQRILRNEANKVPVFRQSYMGKRQGSGFDAFRCNPARRSEARLAMFSSRARRCHAARGCTIRNLAGAILGGTDRAVDCKPDQSGSNLVV